MANAICNIWHIYTIFAREAIYAEGYICCLRFAHAAKSHEVKLTLLPCSIQYFCPDFSWKSRVFVQLRVRNWLFLINWRTITLKNMTPRTKKLKFHWKKIELKEQYVDYSFNNTFLILCFTEELNSILVQHGEEIGLFTSSVIWAVWAED